MKKLRVSMINFIEIGKSMYIFWNGATVYKQKQSILQDER
jgi:hypothetical protein